MNLHLTDADLDQLDPQTREGLLRYYRQAKAAQAEAGKPAPDPFRIVKRTSKRDIAREEAQGLHRNRPAAIDLRGM